MSRSPWQAWLDDILTALGGEDAGFVVKTKTDGKSGSPLVLLSCNYGGCPWGVTIGEIELWELALEAREHWEAKHAPAGMG